MTYEWNDEPPSSSERFLEEALGQHTKVREWEQDEDDPQLWRVERYAMKPVRFYFQNVYTLGVADYAAIRRTHPDIRCIVTAGNWNHFSRDAEAEARKEMVALYNPSRLLGALNRDGEGFYRYRPRD